ncbi:phage tail tape measure C-terminal domain-containing protein [Tunturiibacter gelidiferens]|uniref:phage tail tape measure C-terminal domain-containing protein n=1 Tax=Tunturiibacter gelidiferens TaxID=3069689 RepID=UPI003D9B861B
MRETLDLNKQNSDALAQQAIQMGVATGQLTKLDAARMQAALHTQEYNDALKELQDQAKYIATDKSYHTDDARQAALTSNRNAQNQLTFNRNNQINEDNQNTNPAATSGLKGATGALDDFVIASRDAAAQMHELATNTLKGLNDTILHVLTTPHMTGRQTRDAFGDYGAGLAKSVAGTALQKGEGSVLGAFGFGGGGKLGTKNNPMYVTSADKYQPGSGGGPGGGGGGSQSGFMGMVNKMFGTSFGGFGGGALGPGYDGLDAVQGISQGAFASDQAAGGIATEASDSSALGDIAAFASGGAIDGPALVGEQGPELFVPQGQGDIIPNHKLKNMGGGGHTINIDASGSTDPAQTRVQMMRGIQAAAPHISASTVQSQNQDRRRTPPSQRK